LSPRLSQSPPAQEASWQLHIFGHSTLIENKQPNEHKRHALYSQSIEQEWKTHHMQDDIHFPCVIQREEKLGVFEKRHTSSLIRAYNVHLLIIIR
jgi:hypothetical protein